MQKPPDLDLCITALKLMASELWAVSQTPYIQGWTDMSVDNIIDYFIRLAAKELEEK